MILTLLILINSVRVHPLKESVVLDQKAQARSEILCQTQDWSHDGWLDSFKGSKYQYAGENLAKGFTSNLSEVQAWMASPTHRANILKSQYTMIGIGSDCGITVTLFQG